MRNRKSLRKKRSALRVDTTLGDDSFSGLRSSNEGHPQLFLSNECKIVDLMPEPEGWISAKTRSLGVGRVAAPSRESPTGMVILVPNFETTVSPHSATSSPVTSLGVGCTVSYTKRMFVFVSPSETLSFVASPTAAEF